MPPVSGDTGLGSGLEIGRIEGQWHQKCHDESKWHPEPQEAIIEKSRYALAPETRPNEQSREEEKERHQKDVLPGAVQVEAQPPLAVDDREGAPKIWRCIERKRLGRQKSQIREDRMERQDEEDDKSAQIVERQARPRHH